MISFLLILFLSNPDLRIQEAMVLSKSNSHESSERILDTIKPNRQNEDLYNFYRFLNNFRMNNKKESLIYLDRINELNLPIRYQVLTSLMRQDMEFWSESVDDIARDMLHVRDRLSNNDIGKKTVDIQKSIVRKLDKMIEDLENPPSSKESSASQGNQSNQPNSPLPDSVIPNDGGTGKVEIAKFKKVQEQWGNLPPRERSQVLQELTQGMSPRHREMIENYFANLSKVQSNKR